MPPEIGKITGETNPLNSFIKGFFTMCTFLLSIQVGCPEPKRRAPGVEDEEPRLIDVPRRGGIGRASDAPSLV